MVDMSRHHGSMVWLLSNTQCVWGGVRCWAKHVCELCETTVAHRPDKQTCHSEAVLSRHIANLSICWFVLVTSNDVTLWCWVAAILFTFFCCCYDHNSIYLFTVYCMSKQTWAMLNLHHQHHHHHQTAANKHIEIPFT